MGASNDLAASLIEAGASGYASAASSRLADRHSGTAERFGAGGFRLWQQHYTLRLRELASALLVGEPDLFVGDVIWSRSSFEARDLPAEDLEMSLACLSEVLGEELPESVRAETSAYLDRALAALGATEKHESSTPVSADDRLSLSYLEAALSGDRRRATETVLNAVDEGLSLVDAYEKVLLAAQNRVGEMWHRWEVGVAQEHLVTATTESVMSILTQRAERMPANGKTALVCAVPGNGHDLPARALADFLEAGGWRAVCLGGQIPAAEVVTGLAAFEADLLALSIALTTQIRGAIETVRGARNDRPGVKILLGGRLISRAPDLWRTLGADASASGYEEALRVAAGLVGLS